MEGLSSPIVTLKPLHLEVVSKRYEVSVLTPLYRLAISANHEVLQRYCEVHIYDRCHDNHPVLRWDLLDPFVYVVQHMKKNISFFDRAKTGTDSKPSSWAYSASPITAST
jgi:hypothetical protein